MSEAKKSELDSHESTGTKYFNEIFCQFQDVTSKSQYDEFYEKHGDLEELQPWKPCFHEITDLKSESDCFSCRQIEEEIKLHKYFGIGRFSMSSAQVDPKCKCPPQVALLTTTDDVVFLSIPENKYEPDSNTKADFCCDDHCSLKEEDVHDDKDEPIISGLDYLKYYTLKLRFNDTIDESVQSDAIPQIIDADNEDEDDMYRNPTETYPKMFAAKAMPKIFTKKVDIKSHLPQTTQVDEDEESHSDC